MPAKRSWPDPSIVSLTGGIGAFLELSCPARGRFASGPRWPARMPSASRPMRIQHCGEAWGKPIGDFLERREQTRYGLHALVDFDWMDTAGVPQQGQGFTRDISPKGVFIYSDSQPPAKADVRVEVSLLSIAHAVRNLRMRAEGLIIRVEPPTSAGIGRGFAILNRSCKLHNGGPIDD